MKTNEFKERLHEIGNFQVVESNYQIEIRTKNEAHERIATVSKVEMFVIDTLHLNFVKMHKEIKRDLLNLLVEYASTGLKERAEPKLYIVQLPTNCVDDLIILDAYGDVWKDAWPSKYRMTEQRIKEIDERYWPFAVEVAE